MKTGRYPVATSSKKATPITDKRRKWYSVTLLAQQANRSVDEIVGWIESGKLRGFKGSSGWLVHQDQMDTWRELCKTQPSANRYGNLAKLLNDWPALRPFHEARGRAALARPFDPKKLDQAKAAWDKALAERHITFEPGRPDFGFAPHEVPDPDEPGFKPVDRNRYGSAAEEQEGQLA